MTIQEVGSLCVGVRVRMSVCVTQWQQTTYEWHATVPKCVMVRVQHVCAGVVAYVSIAGADNVNGSVQ